MAYANDRLQRDREQQRTLREKGEFIISASKTLSELYIEKYNFAYACRRSTGKQELSQRFGPEEPNEQKMRSLENDIYAYVKVYFPSKIPLLQEWQSKIGAADAALRLLANGSNVEEYDQNAKGYRDRSHRYILEVDAATVELADGVAHDIAIASSASSFLADWRGCGGSKRDDAAVRDLDH